MKTKCTRMHVHGRDLLMENNFFKSINILTRTCKNLFIYTRYNVLVLLM